MYKMSYSTMIWEKMFKRKGAKMKRMKAVDIVLKDKQKPPIIRPTWTYEPLKFNVENFDPVGILAAMDTADVTTPVGTDNNTLNIDDMKGISTCREVNIEENMECSRETHPNDATETDPFESDESECSSDEESLHFRFRHESGKPPHWQPSLEGPVARNSILGNAIERWISEITIKPSIYGDYVKKTVKAIVESTISYMRAAFPVCSGCYAVEFGSMAEGTRILQPDEFDFVVVVPVLSNPQKTELVSDNFDLQIFVKSVSADLVRGMSAQNGNVLVFLRGLFMYYLQSRIPENWHLIEEDEYHFTAKTITFHIENSGFEVSVDVCFGIPLNASDLGNIWVYNSENALFLRQLQAQCEAEDTTMLVILDSYGRASYSFLSEPATFKYSPAHSRCYMLAKFICKIFLPKVKKKGCSRCLDCLITSFYLKNTMMYLMNHYSGEKDWDDSQLGNRLLEVFEILKFCLYSPQDSFKAYRVLQEPCRLRRFGRHLPTWTSSRIEDPSAEEDDGYSQCYLPHLEGIEKALGKGQQKVARNYWDYSRTRWNFPRLIAKLTDLLSTLKQRQLETASESGFASDRRYFVRYISAIIGVLLRQVFRDLWNWRW